MELLGCTPLGELKLLRSRLLEGAWPQNLKSRVDFAKNLLIAVLILVRHDLVGDLVVAILVAWAVRLVGIGVEWGIRCVGFGQRNACLAWLAA